MTFFVLQQPEGKRSGKGSDDKPSKKFKDSTGKATTLPTPLGRSKGKAQVIWNTVQYRYNRVRFLPNPQKNTP